MFTVWLITQYIYRESMTLSHWENIIYVDNSILNTEKNMEQKDANTTKKSWCYLNRFLLINGKDDWVYRQSNSHKKDVNDI